LKTTHVKLGQLGPMRGQGKCPVTICTTEFLMITVSVPNVGSERDIRECAIGKACDLADSFRTCRLHAAPYRPGAKPTGQGVSDAPQAPPDRPWLRDRQGPCRADYTVYTGEWEVGRIYETRGGPDSLRWFWSMTA
jgi:hypothetical protein